MNFKFEVVQLWPEQRDKKAFERTRFFGLCRTKIDAPTIDRRLDFSLEPLGEGSRIGDCQAGGGAASAAGRVPESARGHSAYTVTTRW